MTPLLALVSLLAGQTEAPPPPPSQPPILRMEGSTSAPVATPDAGTPAAPEVHTATPVTPPLERGSRGAPVFLTINSNRADAKLLRADDDAEACTVPCNRLVPAGPKDIYYLGGKGLTNSNNFDLAEGIKAAQVNAHVGTKAGKISGIVLFAFGTQVLLSGILNMVSYGISQIPSVQQQMAASGQQSFISPTVTLVMAIIELVVGGGAFTTGVILWPNNTTRLTMKPSELPAPPPPAESPAAPVETSNN